MKILKFYLEGQKAKAEDLIDHEDPSCHAVMYRLFSKFEDDISHRQIARQWLEMEWAGYPKHYDTPIAVKIGAKWLHAVKGTPIDEAAKKIAETMQVLRPIVRQEVMNDDGVYLTKVGLPTIFTDWPE